MGRNSAYGSWHRRGHHSRDTYSRHQASLPLGRDAGRHASRGHAHALARHALPRDTIARYTFARHAYTAYASLHTWRSKYHYIQLFLHYKMVEIALLILFLILSPHQWE